jgi:hypothetical protein
MRGFRRSTPGKLADLTYSSFNPDLDRFMRYDRAGDVRPLAPTRESVREVEVPA